MQTAKEGTCEIVTLFFYIKTIYVFRYGYGCEVELVAKYCC